MFVSSEQALLGVSQYEIVIQPDSTRAHLGGEFFISNSMDRTIFSVRTVQRDCKGSSGSIMCDQLVIKMVGEIVKNGHFCIAYSPSVEEEPEVKPGIFIVKSVFYGKYSVMKYIVVEHLHNNS